MKRYLSWQLATIIIMALILGFISMPYSFQSKILPSESEFLKSTYINLGLDLQGGTQLDYKVDLRSVDDADKESLVEGVKEVITKRVNGLGVSEPSIYISQIADEYHIVVELAGIKDIEEAKSVVGKTIQLEFKEESTTAELSEEEKTKRYGYATAALDAVLNGEDIKVVGEADQLAYPEIAAYSETELTPIDDLPETIKNAVSGLSAGDIVQEVATGEDGYIPTYSGEYIPLTGYFVIQVTDHQFVDETESNDKEVQASHVLIGWDTSAVGSDRTQEEAYTLISEILEKAKNGEDFAELAKTYSEDTGSAQNGGDLGYFGTGVMVQEFEDAAFAMSTGDISEIVETQFGYHIIKVTDVKEASTEAVTVEKYAFNQITYATIPDPWVATELTGENFVHADVQFDQNGRPYVSIEFDEEGGKLFEEITSRNINKPLAIFVGGDMISAPTVNEAISGGSAQTTGQFSVEEATDLARDWNTGAIPAPITLAGQYTIGASLGAEALHSSIIAGLIGLIVLGIFMLLYYRLPGLMADIALCIYVILLVFAIKVALPLAVAILIAFGIFGAIIAILLKSSDPGWEKLITFILACFILFFMSFVFSSQITLTLAGIAGVVLSIGMAVDANILIFERIKEELKAEKPFALAIETGFQRAWDSIRDSNFSSLITCAILMYFGSSIIRGFAFNLALGILTSMFTAITITRTFLRSAVGKKALESDFLFGINRKKEHVQLKIIKNSKIWLGISAVLAGISIIVIPVFGFNWGMDFTGGTSMEIKFSQEVTSEQLTTAIAEIDDELDTQSGTESLLVVNQEQSGEPIELGTPIIVKTNDGSYIIKIKHISEETHNYITGTLETRFGEFEETKFTTVGPTIGETLKKKAVIAIFIALVMIVGYIAFAFRKVPRKIGAFRFGICAIIALVHDILIVIGLFVVLGKFANVELDALFITALLTILGFSIHDTIVVFDRIRENLRKGLYSNFAETTDAALNQTLARSINTSFSTLITIVALLIFGADSIFYFVLALTVGIISGTYSSIFIASPLLVLWNKYMEKKEI